MRGPFTARSAPERASAARGPSAEGARLRRAPVPPAQMRSAIGVRAGPATGLPAGRRCPWSAGSSRGFNDPPDRGRPALCGPAACFRARTASQVPDLLASMPGRRPSRAHALAHVQACAEPDPGGGAVEASRLCLDQDPCRPRPVRRGHPDACRLLRGGPRSLLRPGPVCLSRRRLTGPLAPSRRFGQDRHGLASSRPEGRGSGPPFTAPPGPVCARQPSAPSTRFREPRDVPPCEDRMHPAPRTWCRAEGTARPRTKRRPTGTVTQRQAMTAA